MTAAVVKQGKANNIHQKSDESDDENVIGTVNFFEIDESLDGLDSDGEAKCDEENCIDERAEDFSSRPPERIFAPLFRRHLRKEIEKLKTSGNSESSSTHLHWKERNQQRRDVTQHVKTIGDQWHWICDISGDDFHEEKDDGKRHDRQKSALFPAEPSHFVLSLRWWKKFTAKWKMKKVFELNSFRWRCRLS